MANKLIKIYDVEFDENLTPKQINIGTATQTSDMVFKLHIIVPNIINLQTDSCYVAFDLPNAKKSGKIAKIKLPYNLNASFEFFKTENAIDYYHTYINLDSRVLKYVGTLKMNLVIEHLSGEFIECDDDITSEINQMERVDTRSSDTFVLTVTRSSNYEENLYPYDEEEYDEAVVHIDAILKFLAAYQTYAPAKKDTLQVLPTKPNNISNLNGLYYFKDKNEVNYIKNGKIEQVVFEDQIFEQSSKDLFPSTGEYGKIYLDVSANRVYQWKDNKYVEICEENTTNIKNLQDNKLDKVGGNLTNDFNLSIPNLIIAVSNILRFNKLLIQNEGNNSKSRFEVDGNGNAYAKSLEVKDDITVKQGNIDVEEGNIHLKNVDGADTGHGNLTVEGKSKLNNLEVNKLAEFKNTLKIINDLINVIIDDNKINLDAKEVNLKHSFPDSDFTPKSQYLEVYKYVPKTSGMVTFSIGNNAITGYRQQKSFKITNLKGSSIQTANLLQLGNSSNQHVTISNVPFNATLKIKYISSSSSQVSLTIKYVDANTNETKTFTSPKISSIKESNTYSNIVSFDEIVIKENSTIELSSSSSSLSLVDVQFDEVSAGAPYNMIGLDKDGNIIIDSSKGLNTLIKLIGNAVLNGKQIATVDDIAALINGAPEDLNTLNELAQAFKNNKNVIDALNEAIGKKADKTAIPTKINQLQEDTEHQTVTQTQKDLWTNKKDVLEFTDVDYFPSTGELGKIYVSLSSNKIFRWSGRSYVEISSSLELGELSTTAYSGDKGKKNSEDIAKLQQQTGHIYHSLEEVGYTEEDITETNLWKPYDFVNYCKKIKLLPGDKIILKSSYLENLYNKHTFVNNPLFICSFLFLYSDDSIPNLNDNWKTKYLRYLSPNSEWKNILSAGGTSEFNVIIEVKEKDNYYTILYTIYCKSTDSDWDSGGIHTIQFNSSSNTNDNTGYFDGYWVLDNHMISFIDALRHYEISDLTVDDVSVPFYGEFVEPLISNILYSFPINIEVCSNCNYIYEFFPNYHARIITIAKQYGASQLDEDSLIIKFKKYSLGTWNTVFTCTLSAFDYEDSNPFILENRGNSNSLDYTARQWRLVSSKYDKYRQVLYDGQPTSEFGKTTDFLITLTDLSKYKYIKVICLLSPYTSNMDNVHERTHTFDVTVFETLPSKVNTLFYQDRGSSYLDVDGYDLEYVELRLTKINDSEFTIYGNFKTTSAASVCLVNLKIIGIF